MLEFKSFIYILLAVGHGKNYSTQCTCLLINKKRINTKKKKKKQGEKWAEDLNRHLSNWHLKRCSTSVNIRETQVKTTMSYHHTLVRMAIIKMSTNNKHWRGYGGKEAFLHYWWECKVV